MEIELAKKLFHGREKYNCAQAVLKAFQKYNNFSDMEIALHKSSGGGKAEGGVCGALFAAKLQMERPDDKSALENSFREKARYLTCKEIKANKTLSCAQCVETAATILKKEICKRKAGKRKAL